MLRIIDPNVSIPASIVKVLNVVCPSCEFGLTTIGPNTSNSCPYCDKYIPNIWELIYNERYRVGYHLSKE